MTYYKYSTMKIRIAFICAVIIALGLSLSPNSKVSALVSETELGVWVTVFSSENILENPYKADTMIETCKNLGINNIYLQVYRSDKAYYNSSITDNSPYNNLLLKTSIDPIAYIISKASQNNIKVHAWINALSIANNENANIIKKFGKEVIILDQYGKSSLKETNKNASENNYILENQLFLNPMDERVQDYVTKIAEEIITKYPNFSGIHLDYIRYPAALPFTPGSRFTPYGINYGYSGKNLQLFKEKYNIDLKKDTSKEAYHLWDTFRRDSVTSIVEKISTKVKNISPEILVSVTIVPSIERTYLVTLQNWTKWINKKYVDYVVCMNYTDDEELFDLNSESVMLPSIRDNIFMGIGAYLLKNNLDALYKEFKSLKKLSPRGIVIFSYDDIATNKNLQNFIRSNFN